MAPLRNLLLLLAAAALRLTSQPASDAGQEKGIRRHLPDEPVRPEHREHSFNADFYLWFKWKGAQPHEHQFVNSVEKWGFTQVDFSEEPGCCPTATGITACASKGVSTTLSTCTISRWTATGWISHIENVDYPQESLVYLPDSSGAFKGERLPDAGLGYRRLCYGNADEPIPEQFRRKRKGGGGFNQFHLSVVYLPPPQLLPAQADVAPAHRHHRQPGRFVHPPGSAGRPYLLPIGGCSRRSSCNSRLRSAGCGLHGIDGQDLPPGLRPHR